jgi:hypothetical protein
MGDGLRKAPAYGTLTVAAEAFSSFIDALKAPSAK